MSDEDEDLDATLILAAEECPPERFDEIHRFSAADNLILRKLIAHGPVLVRGGRGSGKSALLIEAHRRMQFTTHIFSVYISLRYLPLLQSDGDEYIAHFCSLVSRNVRDELQKRGCQNEFPIVRDQNEFIDAVVTLSQSMQRRLVLLFDDAAHIGREKPLTVFFDLFRTLSTSSVSCKASIYPGVTRFGVRFDVYNDSTVVDVTRSQVGEGSSEFFPSVVAARYPRLARTDKFSERMSPSEFANLVGRAVVGNMRAFVFACTKFNEKHRIGLPEIGECLLDMSQNYYWPLMEEVAPKLGVYEPMIVPSQEIADAISEHVVRAPRGGGRTSAQDRILIHRQIVADYSKPFEILEYLGFLAKREASRALKSGGRGSVFALNLCTLIEKIPGQRITLENARDWTGGSLDAAEIHTSASVFAGIRLPAISDDYNLTILDKPIEVLGQSRAYPYGLTHNKITKLRDEDIITIGQLAIATDAQLLAIETIGVPINRTDSECSQPSNLDVARSTMTGLRTDCSLSRSGAAPQQWRPTLNSATFSP